jgi:hypothetical protein
MTPQLAIHIYVTYIKSLIMATSMRGPRSIGASTVKRGGGGLVGDGISEELFALLWSKDIGGQGALINIPDTVIYKFGQPAEWYFTSNKGRVKKKNRINLSPSRIEEAFLKSITGYDVVATFISARSDVVGDNFGAKEHNVSSSLPNGAEMDAYQPLIEFLDAEGLQNFFHRREGMNGILQRFVEPKTCNNENIRVVWSPKLCFIERSVNRFYLHDAAIGMYERCLTFEGPEFYAVNTPLRGPVLATKCQDLAATIASHVDAVSFSMHNISRIVLICKLDSKDKLWLLYSTSIRCLDPSGSQSAAKSLVNINNTLSIPSNVYLNPMKDFGDKEGKNALVRCVSCAADCFKDLRHPVTYKIVVKHYEHVIRLLLNQVKDSTKSEARALMRWPPERDIIEAAGGVGFGCLQLVPHDDPLAKRSRFDFQRPVEEDELRIPPIFRYLHANLKPHSYNSCRKDPLFLCKHVFVCENCFLVYSEFAMLALKVGDDLTKVLEADPAAKEAIEYAQTKREKCETLKASLVRPIAKLASSPSRTSETYHSHLVGFGDEADANGFYNSNDVHHQPTFPNAILSVTDARDHVARREQGPSEVASLGGLVDTGVTGSAFNIASTERSADTIAARENNFFKDVSKNPQLYDQHPLLHLVTAQQRLTLANDVFSSDGDEHTIHTNSLFSHGTAGRKSDPFDVYTIKMPLPGHRRAPKLPKMLKSASSKSRPAPESSTLHSMFLEQSMRELGQDPARKDTRAGLASPPRSAKNRSVP